MYILTYFIFCVHFPFIFQFVDVLGLGLGPLYFPETAGQAKNCVFCKGVKLGQELVGGCRWLVGWLVGQQWLVGWLGGQQMVGSGLFTKSLLDLEILRESTLAEMFLCIWNGGGGRVFPAQTRLVPLG